MSCFMDDRRGNDFGRRRVVEHETYVELTCTQPVRKLADRPRQNPNPHAVEITDQARVPTQVIPLDETKSALHAVEDSLGITLRGSDP